MCVTNTHYFCSAGVGRTGTYIALSNLLNESKDRSTVNILECVKKMRLRRPHMVQLKVLLLVKSCHGFSLICLLNFLLLSFCCFQQYKVRLVFQGYFVPLSSKMVLVYGEILLCCRSSIIFFTAS